ncbi:hypothetical protein CN907_19540 [Bacillus anthracis]|nr:hypothetical protein CN907_19540 [Bacillus anthracis]
MEFRSFFFIHDKSMQNIFSTNGLVRSGIIENLDEDDSKIIFYIKKLRA